MRTRTPASDAVNTALIELSAENTNIGIFQIWIEAKTVAARAGVSQTTARRYLDELATFRGYERRRIRGTYGYRYCPLAAAL